MKRVTIIDVAKAAGVSRQTVSRAMNGKAEISPATKERVMQAVRELGYQPNRVAQSMVTRRTFTVGLVFPDILNPFFPEVARGVQDTAREQRYNVFLCNTDDNPKIEAEVLQSLTAQPVDGIIILGSCLSDKDLLDFANSYKPIVITNRIIDHPNISRIIVDNVTGGSLAASHLIEQGHTSLGIITNHNIDLATTRRMQGFRTTVEGHELELPAAHIAINAPVIEGGYAAAMELIGKSPHLTSIFAYNDLMALGALRACHDMGLSVPDDIALIGFDDIHLTSISSPSLTTVRVDKYALGMAAMNRLLAMMAQPETQFSDENLPMSLVRRESA